MRTKILFLIFIFFIQATVFAQEPAIITPTDIKLIPNAVNGFSISIDFKLEMNGEQIGGDYWLDIAHRPKFTLQYADKKIPGCAPTMRACKICY